MKKGYYLTLLVLFPLIISAQISPNSKVRSFQMGLSTGLGFNYWVGAFVLSLHLNINGREL